MKAKVVKTCALLIVSVIFFFSFKKENVDFHFNEYWNHSNEAYYEFQYNKNYKVALKHLKWMDENGTSVLPSSPDYLFMAICYVKLGDTANATKSLRKSVLKGFLNIDEDNGWTRPQIGERSFNEIRKELPELKKQYYRSRASIVPLLIQENKYQAVDQFVRNETIKNALSKEDRTKLIQITDSINITEFIAALKNHEALPTSWLIYHLYDEHEKHVPFIDSCLRVELFKGNYSPEAYAFWYDRQLVHVSNKPQKYGAFVDGFPRQLSEIANVDSVDIYRAQIGLPSLWRSAQQKEFSLPASYKH